MRLFGPRLGVLALLVLAFRFRSTMTTSVEDRLAEFVLGGLTWELLPRFEPDTPPEAPHAA